MPHLSHPAPKYRALVVDDERIAREGLSAMLGELPELHVVGLAASAREAVDAIRALRPQLMFLDVQMPDCDGLDMMRRLPEEIWPATIIVTAHSQHALGAFEIRALDYLLKPVDRRRLASAVHRAIRYLRGAPQARPALGTLSGLSARLAVRLGEEVRFIDPGDIEWIEVCGNYLRLRCRGQVYQQRATLGNLANTLGGHRFLRISRSVMVNWEAVNGVRPQPTGRYEFVMRDGSLLASSRRYRRDVLTALATR